jgi:hypothetical protein
MPNIKILAAAALLVGLLLFRMTMLSVENKRLAERAADLETANQGLAYELAANRDALTVREAERRRLADERDKLQFELGEIYENNKTAFDWAGSPCPPDVLECLRR